MVWCPALQGVSYETEYEDLKTLCRSQPQQVAELDYCEREGSPSGACFPSEPVELCSGDGPTQHPSIPLHFVRSRAVSCANLVRRYICAGQTVPPAGFEPAVLAA